MKSLYAYFGLLDLHEIDSPGHSLYQIGLVDSIREAYKEEKFDFYSYYPQDLIESAELKGFPDTGLGRVFNEFRSNLFDKPVHNIEEVLKAIGSKQYQRLYLKARFRNLSALAKKWKDARDFEQMIETAVSAGYKKDEIIILDTDLSLSDSFINRYSACVTIRIPSIDFPGISLKFLNRCLETQLNEKSYDNFNIVFYGNIDTSKYKEGNAKDPILVDALNFTRDFSETVLICKEADFAPYLGVATFGIPRHNRSAIWEKLSQSLIMLNVTKEKYDRERFIPARIYEAMIFGMIPVSYKFNFLCKAFSFESIDDLTEIYKYLLECSPEERQAAYAHFIKDYVNYSSNIITQF
jgi:hypothetical protein